MTNRIRAWVAPVALALMGLGCVKPNKPTAYSTEDVFGLAKPTYAPGRQLHGSVVRLNPMAQMITISLADAAAHGRSPRPVPAGGLFIDDHHSLYAVSIRVGEIAAGEERNTHRRKIARVNHVPVCRKLLPSP